jgi:hypothetical protein
MKQSACLSALVASDSQQLDKTQKTNTKKPFLSVAHQFSFSHTENATAAGTMVLGSNCLDHSVCCFISHGLLYD